MKPYIILRKIWNDDDIIELLIEVSNGRSVFVNEVTIVPNEVQNLIKELSIFREHIHGGIYDIMLGNFGHKYAGGGFHARLHFYGVGRLFISTHQQSEFEDFSNTMVANEAKMHIKTEPVLLDNFISELKLLNLELSDEAILHCV